MAILVECLAQAGFEFPALPPLLVLGTVLVPAAQNAQGGLVVAVGLFSGVRPWAFGLG